jgi:hypothetical protein
MKSLKLICLIGLLYSCTTNVTNITSSIRTKSKDHALSISSSTTIQPSSSPTSIPSIIISSPSYRLSTPSPISRHLTNLSKY